MKNKRIISLILALIMLLAVPVGVFAQEELTNPVTITFAAGDGSGTMDSKEVEKDTEYTLPENEFTAPEGKEFKAWSVDGTEKQPNEKITVSEAKTITAVWETKPVDKVQITFAAGEGTGTMKPVEVEKDTEYTLPENEFTAPEGKEFKAWSVDGTEKQPNEKITVSEAKTITAVWETKPVDKVQITFAAGEGTGTMKPVEVEKDTEYTLPENEFTAPEGKEFKAWSVDGVDMSPGAKITVSEAKTLKAIWRDKKTTPIVGNKLSISKRYDSNGYFYGTVKDENGNRVPYATVSLYNYDSSSYIRNVTTDSNGDFKIYVGYYYDDYRYYDGRYYDGHKVYYDSFNDRYYYYDNNGDKTWLSKNWYYYDGYYYDRDYRYGRYYYGYLRATKDGYSYGDYTLNDYYWDGYWYDGRYYDRKYSVTPTITEANAGSKIVKGTAGDYATVEVYDDDGIKLGKTTANRNGDFTVYLDRDLKYGERIKVEAKDGSRYTSSRYYTVAYKDNIATTDTIARPAYIAGYPDGSFKPEKTVSRAEAVRMFVKLVNNGSELASNPNTAFSDANNGWYSDEINFAVDKGFIKGYSDGTFKPNNEITRAEFAQMISSFVQKGYPGSTGFKDIKGHWASDAISALYGNKNIKGYPDGTFKPNQKLTRAEAVTILNSVFGRNTKVNSLYNINSQGLRTFNDVGTGHWAYYEILDASNAHITNKIDAKDGIEIWK